MVVLVVLAGKGTVRVKASHVWFSAIGRGMDAFRIHGIQGQE